MTKVVWIREKNHNYSGRKKYIIHEDDRTYEILIYSKSITAVTKYSNKSIYYLPVIYKLNLSSITAVTKYSNKSI